MGYLEEQLKSLRASAGADRVKEEETMALSTKDANDPKRLVKIKFLRNTSDGGEDYGPDYKKQVAEVPFNRAQGYISTGRAELVSKDEELEEVEQSARDAGRLPPESKRKS